MLNPSHPIEILGVGAAFIDHILPVTEDFLKKLGGSKGGVEMVDYETFQSIIHNSGAQDTLQTGGSCANTIKGLSQLGHSCALTGKIGLDEPGRFFFENLKQSSIQPWLIETQTPTGQIACLITPDGERTMRDYLGACAEMRGKDLNPEIFENVSLVHIEGYAILNEDLAFQSMKYAKAAHARISFDLANFELVQKFKNVLLPLITQNVDILFANTQEAKALTGLDPEKSCEVLQDLCNIAVVLMGKEGCWVGHNGQLIHCPAYPVVPIDTTGASDLFAAGFIHEILSGSPLKKCADTGARVAGAVVQVLGAELPTQIWEELKLTLRTMS
jgi:sugar/nucleoside kinase (ribokinase family)